MDNSRENNNTKSLHYLRTLTAANLEQVWSTLSREERQQLINYLPCYRRGSNNCRINCDECIKNVKPNFKLSFK